MAAKKSWPSCDCAGAHASCLSGIHVVCRDLVAEPAGAAVEHYHGLALGMDAPSLRCLGVRNIRDLLHFQEMITSSQRSQLGASPLHGQWRNLGWVGALHAALLFRRLQVLLRGVALLHRPFHSAGKDLVELILLHLQRPRSAHAHGYGLEQRLDEVLYVLTHLVSSEIRTNKIDPAVYVLVGKTLFKPETTQTGRDYPFLLVKGRYSPHRQAI